MALGEVLKDNANTNSLEDLFIIFNCTVSLFSNALIGCNTKAV